MDPDCRTYTSADHVHVWRRLARLNPARLIVPSVIGIR